MKASFLSLCPLMRFHVVLVQQSVFTSQLDFEKKKSLTLLLGYRCIPSLLSHLGTLPCIFYGKQTRVLGDGNSPLTSSGRHGNTASSAQTASLQKRRVALCKEHKAFP